MEFILRELEKDTGLVTEERKGEILRFIHLTFCEFFAPYFAKEFLRAGWQDTIVIALQNERAPELSTRLAEMLPFCAALLPRSAQEDAIRDVFQLKNTYMLALCYLETKAYSTLFDEFRRRFEQSLIDAARSSSSTDWFRDLHIYLTVINDAERVQSTDFEPASGEYDLVAFFRRITSDFNVSIGRLAMTYAEQDANAAFRVATECGVDVSRDAPELISRNLDQPAFLDLTINQVMTQQPTDKHLLGLIAEAGLSSIAVAESLFMREPLTLSDEGSAMTSGWSQSKLIGNTLYAQSLDYGIEYCKENSGTDIPLLRQFRRIEPMYVSKWDRFLCVASENLWPSGFILYAGLLLIYVPFMVTILGIVRRALTIKEFIPGAFLASGYFILYFTILTVPIVHAMYVIPYCYNCLLLSSLIGRRRDQSMLVRILRGLLQIDLSRQRKPPRYVGRIFARQMINMQDYERFRQTAAPGA